MYWMTELAESPGAYMMFALAIVLTFYAVFAAGRQYGRTHYFALPSFAREEVLELTLQDFDEQAAVDAMVDAVHVAYLAPFTASVQVISPLTLSLDTGALMTISLEPPVEPVMEIEVWAPPEIDNSQLHDRIEELEAMLSRSLDWGQLMNRRRASHYRALRQTRARLHFMLGPVMEAPRRPTRDRLVAEVIDIGTATRPARLHVVPPAKIRDWRERELVAC